MKKIIAMLLCATMMLPLGMLSALAANGNEDAVTVTRGDLDSVFADGENSLLVFVTGIGQSFSYLFDESYVQPGAFANGTLQDYENYAQLIADHKYTAYWNLFNDFNEQFGRSDTKKTVAKLVIQLLITLFLRRNVVKEDDLRTLVKQLFAFNLVDENGDHNPRVVTPRYTMPVADYPYSSVPEEDGTYSSEARRRFYGSIPCEEAARAKLGENFEEYLYCFNFSPFSYISNNIKELHEYIETILATNRVGAKKVVLIPMSMGASVVNQYLAAYPNVEDNHVRRVVSIVGAWNGSDIMMDLVHKNYADNSADLFYNGIIAGLVGEPYGYLVNFALRLFSKESLRSFIDEALGVFVDEMLLSTPSLYALVPDYGYEEIRPMIKNETIREQTDFYNRAQSTIKERFAALEEQGVTFSFIAGYGLPYGAVTHDYKVFGFLHSAERTNSDEIINIDSTVPGVKYVPYNQKFGRPEDRVLSPDGSIDIADAYYKDSSWFFYEQKHELEHNNTALKLAVDLALGTVKTVADCDDPEEDSVYYPQFNGARDLNDLTRNLLPAYDRWAAAGNTPSAALKASHDACVAMKNSTVNNYAADMQLIQNFRDALIAEGVMDPSAAPSGFEQFMTKTLKKNNDVIYGIFGAKGFLDFTK